MKNDTRRLTILDLVLLIAGLAVGLWLAIDTPNPSLPASEEDWLLFLIFLLGGVSLIGPPLLLRKRYRRPRRTRLGLGEIFWFCQGTASWLLWPPVIIHRVQGDANNRVGEMAPICYVYGTPLMALYITIALLAGGWLRPRPGRKRRASRSWTESFGLILGLIWACTGLWVLTLIYRRDLFQ